MATTPVSRPKQASPFKPSHVEKLARNGDLSTILLSTSASDANQSSAEDLLETMLNQMILSTKKADQALDDALDFIEQSNQRIAALEAQRHQQVA